MPQGQRNAPQGNGDNGGNGEQPQPEFKPLAAITAEIWRDACAAAGFPMNESGQPLVPVSDEKGHGYLVPLMVPSDINMDNLVRALYGHGLRVGQTRTKAAEAPSVQVATDAANSALNGKYKPSREPKSDIIDKEAARRFKEDIVRPKVMAAKPGSNEAAVDATVKKQALLPTGIEKLAELRKAVIADGTYVPKAKGAVVEESVDINITE